MRVISENFVLLFIAALTYLTCYSVVCDLVCDGNLDLPSKAYLADVVLLGQVTNKIKLVPVRTYGRNRYNVTVFVETTFKVGNDSGGTAKIRRLSEITVGIFGPLNGSQCVAEVKYNSSYIFFLQAIKQRNSAAFELTAIPELDSKSSRKVVRSILCDKCAKPPTVKITKKKVTVREGKKLTLNCIVGGLPQPRVTWYHHGNVLIVNTSSLHHVTVKPKKEGSQLVVGKARRSDAGVYKCVATSILGSAHADTTVTVNKVEVSKTPEHAVPCQQQTFCLNGGTCYLVPSLNTQFCACRRGFMGWRCEDKDPFFGLTIDEVRQAEMSFQRFMPIVILGVILAFVAIICLIALLLSRVVQNKDVRVRDRRDRGEGRYRRYNGGVTPSASGAQTPDVMPLMRVYNGDLAVDRTFNFPARPSPPQIPVDPRRAEHNNTNAAREDEYLQTMLAREIPTLRLAGPRSDLAARQSSASNSPADRQQHVSRRPITNDDSFRTRLAAESVTPETPRQHYVRVKPQTTFIPQQSRPTLPSVVSGRSASDSDLQLSPHLPLRSDMLALRPPRSLVLNNAGEQPLGSGNFQNRGGPGGYPADSWRYIDDADGVLNGEVEVPVVASSPVAATPRSTEVENNPSLEPLYPLRLMYNGGPPIHNGGYFLSEPNNNKVVKLPTTTTANGDLLPETTI